jgi:hypothetical protein
MRLGFGVVAERLTFFLFSSFFFVDFLECFSWDVVGGNDG